MYEFLLKLNVIIKFGYRIFFYKCDDNHTSVATFVATLIKMFDLAGLDNLLSNQELLSWALYSSIQQSL